MFTIASNLGTVIEELEASKSEIAERLRALMEPSQWEEQLKEIARDVLGILAPEGHDTFNPILIDSITYFALDSGFIYEMSGTVGTFNPKDGLSNEQIDALAPGILKWVALYKDKSSMARKGHPAGDFYVGGRGREAGEMQSNETIANRLIAILKHEDQTPWLESTNSDGLLAFLKDNYPGQLGAISGLTSLGESRLSELILAVLDAWQEELGVAIQSALIAEVNKALD